MTDDIFFDLYNRQTTDENREALQAYHTAAKAADKAIARHTNAGIRAAELVKIAKHKQKLWERLK